MRFRFKTGALASIVATVAVTIALLLKLRSLERLLCAVAGRWKVASLEVEWVASVYVAVNRITDVSSVDGCSVIVVEAKSVDVFTKTVKIVVLRQSVDKLNELVFINKMSAFCGKNLISGRLAADCKPERWVITPGKCKVEVLM